MAKASTSPEDRGGWESPQAPEARADWEQRPNLAQGADRFCPAAMEWRQWAL